MSLCCRSLTSPFVPGRGKTLKSNAIISGVQSAVTPAVHFPPASSFRTNRRMNNWDDDDDRPATADEQLQHDDL